MVTSSNHGVSSNHGSNIVSDSDPLKQTVHYARDWEKQLGFSENTGSLFEDSPKARVLYSAKTSITSVGLHNSDPVGSRSEFKGQDPQGSDVFRAGSADLGLGTSFEDEQTGFHSVNSPVDEHGFIIKTLSEEVGCQNVWGRSATGIGQELHRAEIVRTTQAGVDRSSATVHWVQSAFQPGNTAASSDSPAVGHMGSAKGEIARGGHHAVWEATKLTGGSIGNGKKIISDCKSLFSAPNGISSTLTYHKPSVIGGKIVVKIPENVAKEGIAHWKDCLVGQFVEKRLPHLVVRNAVDKLWGHKEMPEVLSTDSGLFIFRFMNLEVRDWVLEARIWHIAGKHFILRKWQPNMEMLNLQLKTVPVWVKFFDIPIEYWTEKGLRYVANAIGKPLHLDSLTQSRSRMSFARICVEIDVSCEYPTSFLLDVGGGNETEIGVEYSWKPLKCVHCGIFGHSSTHCHKLGKRVSVLVGKKSVEPPINVVCDKEVSVGVTDSVFDSFNGCNMPHIPLNIMESDHVTPLIGESTHNPLSMLKEDEDPITIQCANVSSTTEIEFTQAIGSATESEGSPIVNTFKNCKLRVDEVDKKASQNRKKNEGSKKKKSSPAPKAPSKPGDGMSK